jgi:hypothetical protein
VVKYDFKKSILLVFCFDTGFCYVTLAGLELAILLPEPIE